MILETSERRKLIKYRISSNKGRLLTFLFMSFEVCKKNLIMQMDHDKKFSFENYFCLLNKKIFYKVKNFHFLIFSKTAEPRIS